MMAKAMVRHGWSAWRNRCLVCSFAATLLAGCVRQAAPPYTLPSLPMQTSQYGSVSSDAEAKLDWNALATLPQAMSPTFDDISALDGSTNVNVRRVTFNEAVLFNFNLSAPRDDSGPVLDGLAVYLRDAPSAGVVTIVGHTDSVGSDEYNFTLSRQRAQSVAAALLQRGCVAAFSIVAMGKRQPLASNADAEGRARNRRVEVFISSSLAANMEAINSRHVNALDLRTGPEGAILPVLDTAPAYRVTGVEQNNLVRLPDITLAAVQSAAPPHITSYSAPATARLRPLVGRGMLRPGATPVALPPIEKNRLLPPDEQ